jgi:hypothetical protein
MPILVEDTRFQPLWWSAQDAVDGHRQRSIMRRSIHPAALAMVKRLKLATADGPVRTPEVPSAELMARWCVPLRCEAKLLGYLWVLDPDGRASGQDLRSVTNCAALATAYLAQTGEQSDQRERRRDELLQHLATGPDRDAAQELVWLERIHPAMRIVVEAPANAGGWELPGGLSAHLVASDHDAATSGTPVPIADLHVAVTRARVTQRALRAGARLSRPTWDELGAWHLILSAPADLSPAAIHPGAQLLAQLPRPDLLITARTTLELGGDVAQAAAALHIHRTTLYYRLDRIAEVTGVDVRTGPERFDLQMALRLAALREVEND